MRVKGIEAPAFLVTTLFLATALITSALQGRRNAESDLSSEVEAVRTQLEEVGSRVDDLESNDQASNVEESSAQLEQVQSDVNQQDSRLDALEAKDDEQDGEIDANRRY